MHPRQICLDVESMGSKLVLEGDDLFIEKPENIYPEVEEFIKSYRNRIVRFLKGDYSERDHAVHQTIDKVLLFMSGVEQEMNEKIGKWLNDDVDAVVMVMQLTIDLHKNGWPNGKEVPANYETEDTDKLSYAIFRLAMTYFRKG